MKEVYVVRHSVWNQIDDELTEVGIEKAEQVAKTFPIFSIVCSSPSNRTQQSAEILSGKIPNVKEEAATAQNSPEISALLLERRTTNPFGIAGVIFNTPEALPAARKAGEALVQLISQLLHELSEDQKALIVSHDGTMIAAEKIILDEIFEAPIDHTYDELEGFIVDQDSQLVKL